jgi:DNA-binding FadR family transcriptional regulator
MTLASISGTTAGQASSLNLEPIKTRRAFEEVCDRLRGHIASGELKPGDRLPSERFLAEGFGVSRPAIREALRMLESAGLVELRKGRHGGAIVRAGDSGHLTQAMHDMVRLGSLPLRDLTEARIDVMDAVIRHFCRRATDEDIEALERNVELTASLAAPGHDEEEVIDAAIAFHRILAAGARNQLFISIVESLTAILRDFLAIPARYPTNQLVQSRRRLLKCLKERDADGASKEMTTNLVELHKRILARANETQGRLKPASATSE